MKIKTDYNGVLLDEKIIRFKNIPGLDWCDNPWFAFIDFSSDTPIDTPDGFVIAANFRFNMAGVEKVTMDYGDGTITEFPARNHNGRSLGLFPHIYKKTGNYTVKATAYNFRGEMIEKSLSFHVLAKASEPNLYIDSPTNGTKINGGSSFTVTWHSKNYLVDKKVNIGLYKLDPEIRPEIINTGHVRYAVYHGPTVQGVAYLGIDVSNNGEQVVTMPLQIPVGQYLIGMYCSYPYPENYETCLNEKVPIEKIENIVVNHASLEEKIVQPTVTSEAYVVPATSTSVFQPLPQKTIEITPVSKDKKTSSEIQNLRKQLNAESVKINKVTKSESKIKDVKSIVNEKSEKIYSTTTVAKSKLPSSFSVERRTLWQVIFSQFKKIFFLH